jgi:amino acid transporter
MQPTFKGQIGLGSATFIGISSMIGSGWLFASFATAQVAGGGAIIAWVIGAFIILLLGLVFSEIAALYPTRGLSAIVPTISHNKYYGFPFAIANWLGIVAVIALEATASVEYFIHIFPQMETIFYVDSQLTIWGTLFALVFIALYTLLNFWGIALLAKANNYIVVFKLVVPLGTAIMVMVTAFHAENFDTGGSFMPNGFNGVFSAVLTTGIIVAFNGFQTVISFANEIKNPQRTIPLSITIAILFTLFVYLLLQIAFIGGMPPEKLINGWKALDFDAPMVTLTGLIGLHFMAIILYADAMVSPAGTAITFVGASTRMFTAMSRKQQVPHYFSHVDKKINMSRRSLIFNIMIAIFFLISFHSWEGLAEILGLFHIISYLSIPIALVVFRRVLDRDSYPFRLPLGGPIAIFLFAFFNYLFTMVTFKTGMNVVIVLMVFQIIFIVLDKEKESLGDAFQKSYPIFSYFIMMLLFTYMSPNNANLLDNMIFIPLVVVFSIFSFYALSIMNVSDHIETELNFYAKASND